MGKQMKVLKDHADPGSQLVDIVFLVPDPTPLDIDLTLVRDLEKVETSQKGAFTRS